MNKLTLVVLLASVCVAYATEETDLATIEDIESESQSPAAPTDAEEVANLSGDSVVFSDFCLRTRDHVLGDIKSNTNSMVANLFTMLFNSAQELGQEALEAQRKATDKLSNQLGNPDAPVENNEYSDDEVDQVIYHGQKRIQNNLVQPKSFIQAIISNLQATGTALARGAANRIKAIQSIQGLGAAVSAVGQICNSFDAYTVLFQNELEELRQQLAQSNPELAKYNLNQVDCVTTKRVLRLGGLCQLSKVAREPLMNLLAIDRPSLGRKA